MTRHFLVSMTFVLPIDMSNMLEPTITFLYEANVTMTFVTSLHSSKTVLGGGGLDGGLPWHCGNRMTDACENITFPILRMRAKHLPEEVLGHVFFP